MALSAQNFRAELEAFHALIFDGCYPAYALSPFGQSSDAELASSVDAITYWVSTGAPVGGVLAMQLSHWKRFRQHQLYIRLACRTPRSFARYVQHVREYRVSKGFPDEVELRWNAQQQDIRDTWKEFEVHEFMKGDRLVAEMKQMLTFKRAAWSRLFTAAQQGQPQQVLNAMSQQDLGYWQGRLNAARRDVADHRQFLRWVDNQRQPLRRDDGQILSHAELLGQRFREVPGVCKRASGDASLFRYW